MTKKRLSIGMFTCLYSQMNGSAHACRYLSEALAKLGHDVHVFAPRIENGHNGHDGHNGYNGYNGNGKLKHLHFHDLGGARVAESTGFVLSFPIHRAFMPGPKNLDIAHIQTHASVGALGIHWAKRSGLPMVGSHHSPMTYYSAQYLPIIGKLLVRNEFLWWYERLALEKYDLCHVPTRTKKEMLLEYKFREPIVSLTNGIADYYFQDIKPNGIREKYNIEDKKVLLYVSRLSPEKHPTRIIKQFKNIQKQIPDAHLLMVGSDGPSSDAVKKIVKKRKYKDFVSYAGKVPFDDLVKLYKTADVSCLWSWVEAEGLVLLEAMAQGTPNVGANGSGIADVIQHGKTGFLANNLEEFEYYVVKLLKDDELRKSFGDRARKVAESYRIENVAKNWIKLYELTINELYPLRYYRRERRERVEVVKKFVKENPSIKF
ncbi:MAG: Glycosyl transferase family 1 [Promethearchaeota archaeon]|nr:MAG: Glycosyl transferase family 1 [Candidatus Lokiarchaeota archaeon]